MLAREIMTQDIEVVTAQDKLQKAARIMRDSDIGFVPVVEGADGQMRLTGVITDRDIAIRHVAEGHGPDCRVEEAMSRKNILTVRPDDNVDNLMQRMAQAQVRRVPVTEDGRLVGVVSQADLALDTDQLDEVGRTVGRISERGPGQRQRQAQS
ncbi:MAG TPA: CBS domain-containing protein [Thermoanaerobaculia bacterium]|nr:CBS domain-containing protein [Thermoanaerobaculia bacterium]